MHWWTCALPRRSQPMRASVAPPLAQQQRRTYPTRQHPRLHGLSHAACRHKPWLCPRSRYAPSSTSSSPPSSSLASRSLGTSRLSSCYCRSCRHFPTTASRGRSRRPWLRCRGYGPKPYHGATRVQRVHQRSPLVAPLMRSWIWHYKPMPNLWSMSW